MASRKKPRKPGFALPAELVRQRVQLASSGAAGMHQDQKARKHRRGQTNRIGSRSARLRAVLRHEDCPGDYSRAGAWAVQPVHGLLRVQRSTGEEPRTAKARTVVDSL
jgi:hypothetical protein